MPPIHEGLSNAILVNFYGVHAARIVHSTFDNSFQHPYQVIRVKKCIFNRQHHCNWLQLKLKGEFLCALHAFATLIRINYL